MFVIIKRMLKTEHRFGKIYTFLLIIGSTERLGKACANSPMNATQDAVLIMLPQCGDADLSSYLSERPREKDDCLKHRLDNLSIEDQCPN